jgi:hypothetical protein
MTENHSAPEPSRLARLSITLIIIGGFVMLVGIYPELIRLNANPQVFGILQIFTFLLGLGIVTLGGYLFVYNTIHHEREQRLRHDVGLRLMATGYVFCAASILADVLGFGSHNIIMEQQAYLGNVQFIGIFAGLGTILAGIFLYAMKVE